MFLVPSILSDQSRAPQVPAWIPTWLFNENDRAEVDSRLSALADELAPDPDRVGFAIKMHQRVAWWLMQKDSRIRCYRFQGSMAQGTVIALRRKDELDLDVYGEYLVTANGLSVEDELQLLKRLLQELREHDRTKTDDAPSFLPVSIEVRRRCITVSFSGDFHLDITLGMRPARRAFPFIDVPERGKPVNKWCLSAPDAFTRHLHERCITYDVEQQRVRALHELTEIDKPRYEDHGKRYVLQAAIMILKHARNIHAERNAPKTRDWQDLLFPSVALTTLAMEAYTRTPSLTIALLEASRAIMTYCETEKPGAIWNPAMPKDEPEDLAYRLKSDPDAWKLAKSWAVSLQATLTSLARRSPLVEELKRIANPEWVAAAEKRRIQGLAQSQAQGGIRAQPTGEVTRAAKPVAACAAVLASAAAAPRTVPHNRFFGGTEILDCPTRAKPLPTSVQHQALLRDGYLGTVVDGEASRAWVDRQGTLHWVGRMRPSACSKSYRVSVYLTDFGYFKARCHEDLALAPNTTTVPHRYPDLSLCLTHPLYGEWQPTYFLSRTVLPWIAWWLACYEGWLATGVWCGDEFPHSGSPGTAAP